MSVGVLVLFSSVALLVLVALYKLMVKRLRRAILVLGCAFNNSSTQMRRLVWELGAWDVV